MSASDLQHGVGPEEVTQYAGGQGTPFPFFNEMTEFSIIKTDGGKSSLGTFLLLEPASVASLFAREWLQCCWQWGALAPDGLIKLVNETLLTQPLLYTSASGYKPAPKLSSCICAVAWLHVGTITLPQGWAYPNHGKLRVYLRVCSYLAIGNGTSTSRWNTAGREWVPAGGYHGHLLPHPPCGAWPVSSVCPRLSTCPLDVPPRQVHILGERWELHDTQVHWFGTNHRNPKKLCLLFISHCQFLEIVIPGKKTGVSKLRGYFSRQVRYLPFFMTLQTTVFKTMTWRLQSKA